MGRLLRVLRGLALYPAVGLCGLLILVLIGSQIEQRIFRRRAERLLSELQFFELRKTTWEEAKAKLQHWGPHLKYSKDCDQRRCSVEITLQEAVYGFLIKRNFLEKLDDYSRWRLRLSYDQGPFVRAEFWLLSWYLRAGGHPAKVTAGVGMRDGVVWSKGIDVWIETYGHPAAWSGDFRTEFTLLAAAQSVSRFHRLSLYRLDPQLAIHPQYMIGRPRRMHHLR